MKESRSGPPTATGHDRRCARSLPAIVLLLIGLAGAPPAAARPAERARFIARHACEIVARLETIHRRGPVETSRDRFIAVSLRGRPQHYVQCIFRDRDTAMTCEAASGAYGNRAADGFPLRLSAEAVAALHALGFVLNDPAENFSREIALSSPPDVRSAAHLMLAALYDAYGARAEASLDINAPRGGPRAVECDAPGS